MSHAKKALPQDVDNLLKDIDQDNLPYRVYDNRNAAEWHHWPLLEKAAQYISWKITHNKSLEKSEMIINP
ncbi:MAG: hypothetical protein ABF461_02595 [Zymomonas mobilis subsp. pomaceae]|uniref:Uncharacterized protein n=1 Tax=Zymomonas mobilis subsp. pomaceae (strain ATCC 29192 / DSM 22645 / JCM 10191 / CCUG 17912 / NBRC 13757 / NCIMB 11200 / NRRL B-4491 / Barker I) TaxID=579138 RepID=F8EU31_ZYMMT|nr:hypothetical protein [Zymomonas mobilis]AEI37111.1 hypothetical protein Zymop_0208 [Zymomonas mobilis subsp. pomaceae ATCC 29192]MDX5948482.1 hypothetical protein [Zymomonas mobilis subsp. pomaceae]GEB89453.1 hypothetical protein ZMO02_10900 [Zymomonas mobilis subsp. pomaceae]